MKTELKQFLKNRKGQVNTDGLVDKLIGVAVFALLGAALVPTVLLAFTNLSQSGIALSSLFGGVLGVLLAVFLFQGIFKALR